MPNLFNSLNAFKVEDGALASGYVCRLGVFDGSQLCHAQRIIFPQHFASRLWAGTPASESKAKRKASCHFSSFFQKPNKKWKSFCIAHPKLQWEDMCPKQQHRQQQANTNSAKDYTVNLYTKHRRVNHTCNSTCHGTCNSTCHGILLTALPVSNPRKANSS